MKHVILVSFFICMPSFAELRNPDQYKTQQVPEAQESAELCRQARQIGRHLSRAARMKRLAQIRRLNIDLANLKSKRSNLEAGIENLENDILEAQKRQQDFMDRDLPVEAEQATRELGELQDQLAEAQKELVGLASKIKDKESQMNDDVETLKKAEVLPEETKPISFKTPITVLVALSVGCGVLFFWIKVRRKPSASD